MNDVVTVVPLRDREPWTTTEIDHLRKMVQTRRSPTMIAAMLQRSETAVANKIHKLHLCPPRENGLCAAAYDAYANGMSWPRVRAIHGVGERAVRRWVRNWGRGRVWPPALDIAEAAK